MNYYNILIGFILGMAAAFVAVVFVLYRIRRSEYPEINDTDEGR